jgi:DNA-binding CsgD family transcriptional regulator
VPIDTTVAEGALVVIVRLRQPMRGVATGRSACHDPHAANRAAGRDGAVLRRTLIVYEDAPGAAAREGGRLRAGGLEVVDGFRTPVPRGRAVVRVGAVASREDAVDALLAALDGAGLVIETTADRAIVDRLVDDLRRLGPVDHRVGAAPEPPALDSDARAILGLLAEGHSLGEAAHLLGLSRRTADRRLAAAREALGVERTTEAIARAQRLGWFRADGRGRDEAR